MSEPNAEASATETPAESTDQQPKPTETVEFWKQKAREQEKRAKENADAAKRLTEIEDAQKSEAQKAADRIAALEKELTTSHLAALRARVQAKHGIDDEDADLFLTGSDEATLTRQAERLAGRSDERKKQGNHAPREGANQSTSKSGDEREFVRSLFANTE
jgi:hypothetical protein